MSFDMGPMVPRQLLEEANQGMERLRRKLDEANSRSKRELEDALKSMQYQVRTLQGQARTAEEQLTRSMEREREMREALANQDVSTVIASLREQNLELGKELEQLRADAESQAANSGQMQEAERELTRLRSLVAELEARVDESHAESQGLAIAAQEAPRLKDDKAALEVKLGAAEREAEAEARERRRLEVERRELLAGQQQLEESLAHTRGMLAAADLEASAQADRRGESERAVAEAERRTQERDAEALHLVRTVEAREEALAAAHREGEALRERVRELEVAAQRREGQVAELSEGLRRAEGEARGEAETLAAHVEEAQARVAGLLAELQRSEADGRSVREQLRAELRRAEGEADALRAALRESREGQDAAMHDRAAALVAEQQARAREQEAAALRETELGKKIKGLEQELRELDRAYVPEAQLRTMQEEARRARDEMAARLERLTADGVRAKEAAAAAAARLEQELAAARAREERREARLAELEAQAFEAERLAESEARQRQSAQAQVRALSGEGHAAGERAAAPPSRMAQAALDMLARCLDRADAAAAKVYADAAMAAAAAPGGMQQQRTAVGIVLTDRTVDMTVPGSPAHALGAIERGDELLMVDGHKVSGATAMAMLRGDDAIGTVVSLLLRRPATGATYAVQLPRASIQVVRRRQEVADELRVLQVVPLPLLYLRRQKLLPASPCSLDSHH
jgi:chromosome segregation ATPase